MMAEWIEYTGSDEQIAEIKSNTHGYIVRDDLGMLSNRIRVSFDLEGISIRPFEYLICDPHPYADMICQQARTGQPVWVRYMSYRYEWDNTLGRIVIDYLKTEVTNTPNWNIPGAEYSFMEFED